MNTKFEYCYTQESFEIYQFKWKPYGKGKWYNPETITYEQVMRELEADIQAQAKKDFPHLFQEEKVIQHKPEWNNPNDQDHFIFRNNVKKEESIDKDFNLIDEINKCKTIRELKTFSLITVSDEEKRAYKNKLQSFSPIAKK